MNFEKRQTGIPARIFGVAHHSVREPQLPCRIGRNEDDLALLRRARPDFEHMRIREGVSEFQNRQVLRLRTGQRVAAVALRELSSGDDADLGLEGHAQGTLGIGLAQLNVAPARGWHFLGEMRRRDQKSGRTVEPGRCSRADPLASGRAGSGLIEIPGDAHDGTAVGRRINARRPSLLRVCARRPPQRTDGKQRQKGGRANLHRDLRWDSHAFPGSPPELGNVSSASHSKPRIAALTESPLQQFHLSRGDPTTVLRQIQPECLRSRRQQAGAMPGDAKDASLDYPRERRHS